MVDLGLEGRGVLNSGASVEGDGARAGSRSGR